MSEMSDDKKDPRHAAMVDALAAGATWEEASDRVGVSERTLYRWCAADPALARAAHAARDSADDLVQFVAFQNCIDPDPAHNTLRMFWLKNRRREMFGDKLEQEYKGGLTIRVQYADSNPNLDAPSAAFLPAPDPGGGESV